MFQGGTNFGYWSGEFLAPQGNQGDLASGGDDGGVGGHIRGAFFSHLLYPGADYKDGYKPITTSYDYDAPLSEAGDPTDKLYIIRSVISKVTIQPSSISGWNAVTEDIFDCPGFWFLTYIVLWV